MFKLFIVLSLNTPLIINKGYTMLLQEVFSSVAPYSWTEQSPDSYEAEFMVEDAFYRVSFLLIKQEWYKSDFWNAQFILVNGKTRDEEGNVGYGIEHTGNAGIVFGTVIHIIKDFINKTQPKLIKFEAKEPNRQRLYSKMLRLFRQPNWKVTEKVIGGSTAYEIKLSK